MEQQKLFMLLLGCRPPERFTEQHDIYFGIGTTLRDLIPGIKKSWPEANGNIHIDAWREVNAVDGYSITIEKISTAEEALKKEQGLFFINLGGYKENEFDEFHYKMLVVAGNIEAAKAKSKKTTFFKHASLEKTANHPNAGSHIDDKYGIDVDDAYKIEDILPAAIKEKYRVKISAQDDGTVTDELHLGYFKLADL